MRASLAGTLPIASPVGQPPAYGTPGSSAQPPGPFANEASIAAALEGEVAGLSSLPRPADWRGPWIELDRDDGGHPVRDPSASVSEFIFDAVPIVLQ